MTASELVALAFEARQKAYAPYSHFTVGAALLVAGGEVYLGCNVENASYGGSICAERTAAVKAVSEGERAFEAIAIVGFADGADEGSRGYAYPCGICRQFLREFAVPGMRVYVARTPQDIVETTLDDLLPRAFGPQNLAP